MTDQIYTAHITDRTTGETREVKFDHGWDASGAYLWSDGNYGTQCNRAIFFGHPAPEAFTGDEYRFHVRCTDAGGREVFVDDWRLASADP